MLVLGGCGFIGRNLVTHLRANKLVRAIVVADKSMPATSNLHPLHKAAYDDKGLLTFKHADLAKPDHVARVFKSATFDYVFNLCGETRFGLTDKDYQMKCVDTAERCAAAAAEHGVKKFVEVSTAQVYKSDKSASSESSELKPWTVQAVKRLEADRRADKIRGAALGGSAPGHRVRRGRPHRPHAAPGVRSGVPGGQGEDAIPMGRRLAHQRGTSTYIRALAWRA